MTIDLIRRNRLRAIERKIARTDRMLQYIGDALGDGRHTVSITTGPPTLIEVNDTEMFGPERFVVDICDADLPLEWVVEAVERHTSTELVDFVLPTRWPVDLLPPLQANEYERLKQSIAERGVMVPIVVDAADGSVVDGLHRLIACFELKIKCPIEVRTFASEVDKLETALSLNCTRRHLSQKSLRSAIGEYLMRDPDIANNHLADLLGVSNNTVARVRQCLEEVGQIDVLTTFRGRDGKVRPRTYKRVIINSPRELDAAMAAMPLLPKQCNGKAIDYRSAMRLSARHAKKLEWSRSADNAPDICIHDIEIRHCRFQDLEVDDNSVPLICTDFPYIKEFVPQLGELAAFAERVLVDGGLFVTYTGKYNLDIVMSEFGNHLHYRWMIASAWKGHANLIPHVDAVSKWKPILIYSKGDWQKRNKWPDLLYGEGKDKQWHPWQQPLVEVERLVRYFSDPGDLVLDPCGGSFTTAVACLKQHRRFLGCDVDADAIGKGRQRLAEEWKLLQDKGGRNNG